MHFVQVLPSDLGVQLRLGNDAQALPRVLRDSERFHIPKDGATMGPDLVRVSQLPNLVCGEGGVS